MPRAYILSSALFLLVVVCSTSCSSSQNALANFCAGQPGQISNLNEARDLINQLNNDKQQKCDAEHRESLLELAKVISEDNMKDICSESTYNSIKSFHETFISLPSSKKDLDRKNFKPIPKEVRDYFITLASDISLACSRRLIDRFNGQLKRQLFQLREINEFKNVRKLLAKYLENSDAEEKEPKHLSEIKIRQHDKENPLIRLAIGNFGQTKKTDLLRVMEACEVRYNKVFVELFKPVLLLNKLGYGQNRFSMQETMALLSREFVPWFLAIDTCDLLQSFDIVVVVDSKEKSYDEQPRLITSEEAERLKATSGKGGKRLLDFDSPQPLEMDHERLEFVQITEQKNIRDVIEKFQIENDRLIKGNSKALNTSKYGGEGKPFEIDLSSYGIGR